MRYSVVIYVLWFNNLVFWLPQSSVWKPYSPPPPPGGIHKYVVPLTQHLGLNFFPLLYLFYPFNLNFLFIFPLSSYFLQISLYFLCLSSYFPPDDIADMGGGGVFSYVYPLVNTRGSILPPFLKTGEKNLSCRSLNITGGSLPSVLFLTLSKSEYFRIFSRTFDMIYKCNTIHRNLSYTR